MTIATVLNCVAIALNVFALAVSIRVVVKTRRNERAIKALREKLSGV